MPRRRGADSPTQFGLLLAPSPGLACGVDEAGRGPLAGPVFAAAVILDPAAPIDGLRDSKVLSAGRRDALAVLIRERAIAWAVASASVAEIDSLNILQATMLAMRRAVDALDPAPTLARVDGNRAPRLRCAVEGLVPSPDEALIDGNRCPALACRARAIVKGDRDVASISAASILAKTARDAALLRLHADWPMYGFDVHKGYPTAEHLRRLRALGPSPEHRRSFAPVRALLDGAQRS